MPYYKLLSDKYTSWTTAMPGQLFQQVNTLNVFTSDTEKEMYLTGEYPPNEIHLLQFLRNESISGNINKYNFCCNLLYSMYKHVQRTS